MNVNFWYFFVGSISPDNEANSDAVTKSCEECYPGDDVVDYAGCSLYELPASSITFTGHEQSFADWMYWRYSRLSKFNKPILVTELGISDTPEKQEAWMQHAFADVKQFPLVKGLIYYNSKDMTSYKK